MTLKVSDFWVPKELLEVLSDEAEKELNESVLKGDEQKVI